MVCLAARLLPAAVKLKLGALAGPQRGEVLARVSDCESQGVAVESQHCIVGNSRTDRNTPSTRAFASGPEAGVSIAIADFLKPGRVPA